MLQESGNSKDIKIMTWNTFEIYFLGKFIYVFWTLRFLLKISYVCMFLSFGLSFKNYIIFYVFRLEPSPRFLDFLKRMYLYRGTKN